jgi:hypothetical protein
LRVTTGSDADVELRGCGDLVTGTSDSEFIFKGIDVGCNYTILVTRDGVADEYEMFFDSACVVDYSASGEFSVAPDTPEEGEKYPADSTDETGTEGEMGTPAKILRIAIPIIIINLIGIFLIVRIIRG